MIMTASSDAALTKPSPEKIAQPQTMVAPSGLNGADLLLADKNVTVKAAASSASKSDSTLSGLLGSLQIVGSELHCGASYVGHAAGVLAHQGELLGEGIATGAVLNPVNGASELVNGAFGTNIGKVQFSNQSEVDRSIAGKLGTAVGTVADFAALTVATGGAADAVGLTGVAASAARLGAAGLITGGLLSPTGGTGVEILERRALGAGIGGVGGAVGGLAAEGIVAAASGIESSVIKRVATAAGASALGAIFSAGSAEGQTLIVTGKPATPSSLLWSAGIGAAGGALGAARVAARVDTPAPAEAPAKALPIVDSTVRPEVSADATAKTPAPLDSSGRPLTDGNAERIAAAHPQLTDGQMLEQRMALQKDMDNYKGGSDGRSVSQLLADSLLSATQKETVLNVLAETRDSFLKPDANGQVSEQQQGNYWHTLGELKEGLESAKANGLSADETQSALLSGILSDSHKIGFSRWSGNGNFFTHHLDGALTADTILGRYDLPSEQTVAVRQAVLEHQISPPNFMSRMYAFEIRSGMKAAGVTPTDADNANIANIQKMIGDPFNSPSATDANGVRTLDFTPAERALLQKYVGAGAENWYIPNSQAGMVGIAADVFDNYLPETAVDGTPIKGPFKIAGLRGPTENPPDLTLDSAIAGIKHNMNQSLQLLTPVDQARAAVRMSQSDIVYRQAKQATEDWMQQTLGITPGADTPYLSKPLAPPPAGATPEAIAAWRQTPDVQLGIQIQGNFAEQLLKMRMREQSVHAHS
jgi:hypothetical protein